MTIDEAIRTLDDWSRDNYPPPLADEINALHLGIEALKRIQSMRKDIVRLGYPLLPGETK